MAGNQNLVAKIIINAQDNASKAFQSIQDNAGKLAAALATTFAASVFSSSVSDAAQFELQLDKVSVKTGVTGNELENLKNKAIEIGNQFGKTGTEALQGLEIIASAGFSASDAIKLLPAALDLADNSGVELAASSSNLINIMKTLGLDVSEAGRVTDVLAIASKSANTNVANLTTALLGAGGVSKATGHTLEETSAILGVLANSGLQGAEASTALRNITLELQDTTKGAGEAVKNMGINSTDVVTVFKELAKKGKESDEVLMSFDKANIAAAFGIRENIKDYDSLVGGLKKISGAAHQASDDLGDNFQSALEDFGAMFTNLKVQLGTPILEPLKNSLNQLKDQFQVLLNDGTLTKVGQSLADVFKAGGDWAVEFVKKTDFTQIGENIKNFASNVSQTFQVISDDARQAGNVVDAVTGVFSAGFNTIQAAAALLESGVTAVFGGMNKMIGQVATGWGEIFALIPGFGSVGESLKSVGAYMTQSGNAAIEFAKALKDEAGKQLDEAGVAANKANNAFGELFNSAESGTQKLDKIWGVSEKLRESLNGIESKEISITADSRDAQDKVDHLKKPTEHTHTAIADTRDAEQAKANLTTPTFSTHYVNVSYTDNGNGTASVGGQTVYHQTGSNYWGDKPQGYSVGGAIDFKRRKGKLDGYGGGDTVPAYLEAGEFIMRKEAVAMYGTDFMSQINNTKVDGTLPTIKIPRGNDDVLLPIQYFSTGGAVGIKAALSSAKATQQSVEKDLYFAESDFNEWVRSGRATEAASVVGYTNRFNAAKTAVQNAKAKVEDLQKQYDAAVKAEEESAKKQADEKAAQENTSQQQTSPRQTSSTQPQATLTQVNTYTASNYRRAQQEKAAQEKAVNDAEMLRLYPEKYDPNYEPPQPPPKQNKNTFNPVAESEKNRITAEIRVQEKAKKQADDLYKQKEDGFRLSGDEIGLENLRFEKEKSDLVDNAQALAQAEKNHKLALQKIQAKKDEEAKKAAEKLAEEKQREAEKTAQEKARLAEKQAADLYKQKEEGFKLSGDEVELENLRFEKEKSDLAGNKEALAQAEKNHQLTLQKIQDKKDEEAKKEADQILQKKIAYLKEQEQQEKDRLERVAKEREEAFLNLGKKTQSTDSNNINTSANTEKQVSNQVITIRFELSGKTAQGQFSQTDANAVVDILRNAAASGLPASFIR